MKDFNTVTDAVVYVIKHYKSGHKFYGNELHGDVSAIYEPAGKKYPDTILRIMRRYCSDDYELVNRKESLYIKL